MGEEETMREKKLRQLEPEELRRVAGGSEGVSDPWPMPPLIDPWPVPPRVDGPTDPWPNPPKAK
jgi:hypothetical protein